ncbi:hypothetical protein RFI_11023 [Reticulomyxa filosa]|uniref:Uncharacterized protein n=1 Tax=Reticulomyxa filosa TaxID=46433 RepID=X6NIG4_RETFI|nr:hypothetical protein RFI_11023 [Reticulomyxa filosa]|eukprot:ETO26115.1 hypothetical protein RFI_11023 [Reticulomyxa filosa]
MSVPNFKSLRYQTTFLNVLILSPQKKSKDAPFVLPKFDSFASISQTHILAINNNPLFHKALSLRSITTCCDAVCEIKRNISDIAIISFSCYLLYQLLMTKKFNILNQMDFIANLSNRFFVYLVLFLKFVYYKGMTVLTTLCLTEIFFCSNIFFSENYYFVKSPFAFYSASIRYCIDLIKLEYVSLSIFHILIHLLQSSSFDLNGPFFNIFVFNIFSILFMYGKFVVKSNILILF